MRRILILIGLATAVIMAAVAVFVLSTLPPRAMRPAAAGEPRHARRGRVACAFVAIRRQWHDRGDCRGCQSRAGLDFVVLTDHGDGTRALEAPRYVHDVLIIDAVEINTDSGHLVALSLRGAVELSAGGRRPRRAR